MTDQPEGQQQINIDLDGLVARYGRKLAQVELEAELAVQRAQRAEAQRDALYERLLEAEAEDAEDLVGPVEESAE